MTIITKKNLLHIDVFNIYFAILKTNQWYILISDIFVRKKNYYMYLVICKTNDS